MLNLLKVVHYKMLPIVGSCGYEAKSVISKGTASNVTVAIKKGTGDFYAVKTQTMGFNGITFSELDIVSRCDHPNIIKSVDVLVPSPGCGVEDFGYVMKLGRSIDSLDFRSHIQSYLRDILSGLCYLHENGILHLNIKLENLIRLNDKVVIIDFTLANQNHLTDIGSMIPSDILDFTTLGPESVPEDGKVPVSYASDIWALGILILKVYDINIQNLDPSTLIKHIKNNPIANLVKSMLNRDPAKRPSAREILESRLFSEKVGDLIYQPDMGVYNVIPDEQTRELMKLQAIMIQRVIPNADVEILFLALDLFYRYSGLVENKNGTYQGALVICANMALFTITGLNFSSAFWDYAMEYYKFDLREERIFDLEMDILHKLGGKINVNAVYRYANNVEQLFAGFDLVYFASNILTLSRLDIEKWSSILDEKLSIDEFGDNKSMTINDFVNF